jgi:hypothetical protein
MTILRHAFRQAGAEVMGLGVSAKQSIYYGWLLLRSASLFHLIK